MTGMPFDLVHLAAQAACAGGAFVQAQGRKGMAQGRNGAEAQDGHAPEWVSKGHNDWVTEVDQGTERIIREVLLAGAPGSMVVGEELNPGAVGDGLAWIVDPLDGTTNFLHGYPQYAVSIAAARDGVLEAAVVLDVPRECCYGAARGQGAWLGSTRLSVSAISDPARALLGTGYPFKHLDELERYLDQFRRILPATSGVRRAGSAALDLADVAAGRLDGFWELMLAPWDTAAGILLVREAGGIVTDLDGNDAGLEHTGIVAGNPALHRWLLDKVRA
jgi:myo-inositol-1(or 4)-monophosphatase